ncbi:MAG TPA: SRPBCC family protein [Solirubrobacteraceae bacterium]|nr:SRPBCC family protein [Solirubrobacteraceae bacterium]
MPTTRRTRTIDASPEELWSVVADPHHLPRWWPRVTRVEGVEEEGFTIVLATDRGRMVRADQRVVESVAPRVRTWTQELEGTPFARLLREARTTIELTPDEPGTRVSLELRQAMRGISRLGGFLVSRAARRQLDAALHDLERIVG